MAKTDETDRLSPLSLAFVGDSVYDMLVRSRLVKEAQRPVKELHSLAVKQVCAGAQAEAIKALLPSLTQEEAEIFKRGRNANPAGHPKNQSVGDYHYATGFECLLGWLWLKGETERVNSLFEIITEAENDR